MNDYTKMYRLCAKSGVDYILSEIGLLNNIFSSDWFCISSSDFNTMVKNSNVQFFEMHGNKPTCKINTFEREVIKSSLNTLSDKLLDFHEKNYLNLLMTFDSKHIDYAVNNGTCVASISLVQKVLWGTVFDITFYGNIEYALYLIREYISLVNVNLVKTKANNMCVSMACFENHLDVLVKILSKYRVPCSTNILNFQSSMGYVDSIYEISENVKPILAIINSLNYSVMQIR